LTLKITWEIIESIDDLVRYESLWNGLSNATPDGFFTSPTWLLKWIDIYWQKNWQLSVIIGKIDDELSVFAPFYIQNKNVLGINQRFMFPLGQGEVESAEVASEYQDILIAVNNDEIYASIAKQIENLTYDNLSWRAVSPQAKVLKVQKYITRIKVVIAGTRYSIKNNKDNNFLVSKNNRYKWNKCKRQLLENDGNFFWCNTEQLEHHWQQLEKMHTQRWNLKNKSGAFSNKLFTTFHQNLIKDGLCKISVLTIDGHLAAINYYLIGNDCLYFYQSGWENKYSSLSPGFALHKWSIENNNLNCYDFMMGDQKQSYKNSYSCNHINDMYTVKQSKSPIKYWLYKLITKLITKI
jgi:CelD/BcsL family acetyltransferase involved in cellulose biosynthesis